LRVEFNHLSGKERGDAGDMILGVREALMDLGPEQARGTLEYRLAAFAVFADFLQSHDVVAGW